MKDEKGKQGMMVGFSPVVDLSSLEWVSVEVVAEGDWDLVGKEGI